LILPIAEHSLTYFCLSTYLKLQFNMPQSVLVKRT
jgi:hypothetical protein